MMFRRSIYVITLVALGNVPPAISQTRSQSQAVQSFIAEMADKHGFDHAELQEVFGDTRFRPRIVELMNKQTKRKPWDDYRSLFINNEKITGGRRFWQSNRAQLALASEKYGVPEEIVVAVIGVETHYGRHTGRFKVLEALTTLAFDYPARASLFRTGAGALSAFGARRVDAARNSPRLVRRRDGHRAVHAGKLSALRGGLRRRWSNAICSPTPPMRSGALPTT